MGTHGARQASEIVANAEQVLALELLCAAQGLDLRRPLQPGAGARAAREAVRLVVPQLKEDRITSEDFAACVALVRDGRLIEAVEREVGPLD